MLIHNYYKTLLRYNRLIIIMRRSCLGMFESRLKF